MLYLEITTVGEVAFSHSMKLEEGYRYDIPFDETSLPYIPVADLLKKEGLLPEGTEPGFAHPKGYLGIVKSADMLLRSRPDSARFIRACFTNDLFLKYEDFRKKAFLTVIRSPHHVFCKTKAFASEASRRVRYSGRR